MESFRHRVIQALDLLLTDDAATWAETYATASQIMANPSPTQVSVQNLRPLLCERFPAKSAEVSTLSFNLELADLKQMDETISAYYKRVESIIMRVGARDYPVAPASSPGAVALSLLENAMLDTIIRAFLKGLADPDVRRKATRGLAANNRSLRSIYILAEQARRTKEEISKLNEEEVRAKEMTMLRIVVQNSMTKSQFNNLVALYHTNANASSNVNYDRWKINELTKVLVRPDKSIKENYYKPVEPRGGCYNSRKDNGHECHPVPAWEQAYLREIVFGSTPQA